MLISYGKNMRTPSIGRVVILKALDNASTFCIPRPNQVKIIKYVSKLFKMQ